MEGIWILIDCWFCEGGGVFRINGWEFDWACVPVCSEDPDKSDLCLLVRCRCFLLG